MINCPMDVIAAAIRESVAQASAVPVPCSDVGVVLTQVILPHWQVDYESMPNGSLSVWGEDDMGAQWAITLHAV